MHFRKLSIGTIRAAVWCPVTTEAAAGAQLGLNVRGELLKTVQDVGSTAHTSYNRRNVEVQILLFSEPRRTPIYVLA